MNLGLLSMNGYVKSLVEPDWQKQFAEWRDLLTKCRQKPSGRRVHGLRVATLRLRAEVDFWLLDQDDDNPLGDAAKRWRKQADRVRTALSPVRDTDVYLDMLKKLRANHGAKADQSRVSPGFVGEIDKLGSRLKEKQESAKKELLREIEKRQVKLEKSSHQLQVDLGKRTVWAGSDRVRVIRELIAGLATEVPSLNADNLHEFRKRAKTARYLSEVAAKKDPHAARLAVLLKKMQNAAGTWHDSQTLASHAQRILGREGDGVVRLLEKIAAESLQSALDECREITAQLLDLSARNGISGEALPPKKPVRRAEIGTGISRKRYA